MPEKNLLEDIIETGINEKVRKAHNSFLDGLRRDIDEMFEQNLEPKVLREKILERIDNARCARCDSRYY